jgi:nitrate reductase molybdenum cofactor assembly chaperone NarJ/NarW
MKILTVISRLIEYPTPELFEARLPIEQLIYDAPELDAINKAALMDFVEARWEMGLLNWQSDYDSLFDRGRSLSLLLFEHIHGESRDRGQAMIDLITTYREAGLELGVKELPDYIPLFLEFLSTQEPETAKKWLSDVGAIIGLLAARLKQRECDYSALFKAILHIAGVTVDESKLAEDIAGEARDDTNEALDKVWEEEMVTFGPNSQTDDTCGTSQNRPSETQSRDKDIPISIMQPQQPPVNTDSAVNFVENR